MITLMELVCVEVENVLISLGSKIFTSPASDGSLHASKKIIISISLEMRVFK